MSVIHTEGLARVCLKPQVFINPAQIFNRDLSILAISTFGNQKARLFEEKSKEWAGLRIFEGLAASGLRSIRYSKEICAKLDFLHANDLAPDAVEEIKTNVAMNEVDIHITQGDSNRELYASPKPWDVVDLDPYGSVAMFIEPAIANLSNGGLLCATSTDMATLWGNNPDTCFYKYGGTSVRLDSCHEYALRLILHQIRSTANKYQKAVVPLLSLSIDFYVRLFVQVRTKASMCKNAMLDTAVLLTCSACPAYFVQPFGRQIKGKILPTRVAHDRLCPYWDSELILNGPFYAGPLHSQDFITEMLETLPQIPSLSTSSRIQGMLTAAKYELNEPLYFDLAKTCKFLKISVIPSKKLRSAFKSQGLTIGQSHTDAMHYKTNATWGQIYDILKHWKVGYADLFQGIKPDTPGHRILAKENSTPVPNWDLDVTEAESLILNVKRYPPNPEPNWGPKARAKK